MAEIIRIDFGARQNREIDVTKLELSGRKLREGLIAPATETTEAELAPDHTSEPIKNMEDIMRVSQYLIYNERYRDNMLFIVGINFGLRVGDLVNIRFCDIINDDFTIKENFPVFEQKTRNTRKHKKNRYITINTAVVEAMTLYLENTPGVKMSDYMFKSESNRGKNVNAPLNRKSVDRILKGIADDLDLDIKMSTHTLRKTWAYHQMLMSHNDPRKLLLLSKMMGHSSTTVTLEYIGITGEEIEEAYRNLNLGSAAHNYLNSGIGEQEELVG